MPAAEPSAFWQLLERLMEERKLSQRAVARIVGVSKQTLQNWKTKPHVKPLYANVKALSRLFRVPIADFYAAIDAGEVDEPAYELPIPVWRAIVDDYRLTPEGRNLSPALVAKLYRAPSPGFTRRLVHAARVELESRPGKRR